MTWKSVTEELPPCDGNYCVKLKCHRLDNEDEWAVCGYNGLGFFYASSSGLSTDWPTNKYLSVNYWFKETRTKKYGKVI